MEVKVDKIPKIVPSPISENMMELQESFYLIREDGVRVLIPEGTRSNGLTIPFPIVALLPFIRFIFPRWHPDYSYIVIAHDSMIGENKSPYAKLISPGSQPVRLSWKEATKWVEDYLKTNNTPVCKRKVIVAAIRYWGDLKRHLFRG